MKCCFAPHSSVGLPTHKACCITTVTLVAQRGPVESWKHHPKHQVYMHGRTLPDAYSALAWHLLQAMHSQLQPPGTTTEYASKTKNIKIANSRCLCNGSVMVCFEQTMGFRGGGPHTPHCPEGSTLITTMFKAEACSRPTRRGCSAARWCKHKMQQSPHRRLATTCCMLIDKSALCRNTGLPLLLHLRTSA